MPDDKPKDVLGEVWSKLAWLLVVMPGFLTLLIATLVAGKSLGDEFQVTIYSVILTCVTAPLAVGICMCWVRTSPSVNFMFALPVVLTLVSLAAGLVLGFAIQNDWLYRGLRNMPLTQSVNKISDSRPLAVLMKQNDKGALDLLGDARPKKTTDAFIVVTLSDARKFEGWPEIYEITDTETQLYLSPACTVTTGANNASEVKMIPGPGVLVYEREIVSIEFIERAASPCYLLWYPQ